MPPAASSPSRFDFSRRVRDPRTRRLLIALAIVLLLLLIARIAAPGLIRDAINARLSRIDGYASQVTDVDLQLFRGAYRIKGLRLDRRVADGLEPFLASEEIDFSLAWRTLLQGRILSDIVTRDITFTSVPTPEDATAAPVTKPPWQEVINDLFPIEITRFIAERGSIRWKNPTTTGRICPADSGRSGSRIERHCTKRKREPRARSQLQTDRRGWPAAANRKITADQRLEQQGQIIVHKQLNSQLAGWHGGSGHSVNHNMASGWPLARFHHENA
jgi:hypothetical protein